MIYDIICSTKKQDNTEYRTASLPAATVLDTKWCLLLQGTASGHGMTHQLP